jgi:hypothetical protein
MSSILDKFKFGKRVKVVGECGYPKGAKGKIAKPPSIPVLVKEYGINYFRKVETPDGEKIYVWVVFDKPEIDRSDGLPTGQAEIRTENLDII